MIAARTPTLLRASLRTASQVTPRVGQASIPAARSITNLAKKQYTAHGRAEGKGRDGHALLVGDQVGLEVSLGLPKELGGNGAGNNPEELFSLAYSSCFLSALQLVARNAKEQLPSDTSVDALVSGRECSGSKGFVAVTDLLSAPLNRSTSDPPKDLRALPLP